MSGPRRREKQLAYSAAAPWMADEPVRRQKAQKILAVVGHFLGRDGAQPLAGLTVVDLGCSVGIIADTLAAAGARTVGVDIDVPGLAAAHGRYGERVGFLCADGEALPLPDASVDIAVFNHIYEHVVDPEAVMAELRRVLHPDGVLYLGLGNRLGVMEPHYRLPFLSWLPQRAADAYIRGAGKAERYHERFRTRRGLRRLVRGWHVWDYTLPVLAEPAAFAAGDVVPGAVSRLPPALLRAAFPLVPTYVWVASPSGRGPAGPHLGVPPRQVRPL